MRPELHLHVLVFREGETWVAQVLERDIAAHGASPYSALAAVKLLIQSHANFDTRHQRQPFSRLDRAPDVYWRALERARMLPQPERVLMHPAAISASITDEPITTA